MKVDYLSYIKKNNNLIGNVIRSLVMCLGHVTRVEILTKIKSRLG